MSISGSVIYGMTYITLGFKFCHQGFNQHRMFINSCVWVLVHVGFLFLARFSCCCCVVLPSSLQLLVLRTLPAEGLLFLAVCGSD